MSFAEGESKTGLTEEGMALPIAADAAEALDERSKSQDDYEEQEQDYQDDILEGETEEEALQRHIEEGKIGKGKTLRRWKDTEEKQRRVETGRHESKVQRYGQIYEEVKALRTETRHSVRDLRERFKENGVIQNKDQFIVRLIAQERNEHEGKVAAIKSLQQWRLTDLELHNFINRCHRKGIAGKLDLATQWVYEQEEAGGDVNFKEGLAFYSSIGILQPRSSAHTQQQWREWREWEDALTSALERHKSRGAENAAKGAEPHGPDASCNEDSTVCNSPWSSERGGGGAGSFGGFSGSLRASSAHGEGDVAGGNGFPWFRSQSGTAPEASMNGTRLPRRGRAQAKRDSGEEKRWWTWRSYSPPSSLARQKSADNARKMAAERKAATAFVQSTNGAAAAVAAVPLPRVLDPPDGGGGTGKPGEAVVRASGGYLPPRHPLANLQLSPTNTAAPADVGEVDAGVVDSGTESGGSSGAEGAPSGEADANRQSLRARGAARTRAKGPAGGVVVESPDPLEEEGPAPTEEEGRRVERRSGRRRQVFDDEAPSDGRSASLSGVFSGLADWLMPGMDGTHSRGSRPDGGRELILEVYPQSPRSPQTPPRRGGAKSAPVTPRGRPTASSVLREGGWFYNGDSDYSTEEENGSFESEDEGFWADSDATDPPRKIGGGGGLSILKRLRMLFT